MHNLAHGNGHTAHRTVIPDCILNTIIPGTTLVKFGIHQRTDITGTIRLHITIYIHIPFCNIKCIYCDFYSVVDQKSTIPDFFKALFKEIQSINTDTSKWDIDTIFIGGGTPSLINPDLISKLIDQLSIKFNLSNIKEFSSAHAGLR